MNDILLEAVELLLAETPNDPELLAMKDLLTSYPPSATLDICDQDPPDSVGGTHVTQ